LVAAVEGYFLFVFVFLFGEGRGRAGGILGPNGGDESEASLASIFLGDDQSNGLNGGRGKGSDNEVGGGRQEVGASVMVEQAPFISPVVREGEFGGNCERFGRKAFGPGLEGHSSGE
jgi:hypothetical protein